ncbi:hypothetical protein BD769DRAFT_1665684 [Suillus cothurnatus]|nr:hypothetical protein BD769DRAFT_1665684 [Suillus cothurnatus]
MFPEDEAGFGIDDQCYIGSSGLLVKPVMQKGAKEVFVYIAEDQVGSFPLPFIYTHTPTLMHTKLLGLLRLLHQPRPPPQKSTHHPLLNFEEEEEETDQDMDDTSDELSSYGTCIVCQEDLNEPKAFGSLGLIQPSRLLRKHPDSHSQYLNELMTMPQSLDRASPHDTTFPPANAEELDATSLPNFDGLPTQHIHSTLVSGSTHLHVAT